MTRAEFDAFPPFFENACSSGKPVLVVTHERPDGDAAGSALGMVSLLNDNGIPAQVYFQDPLPDCYESFAADIPAATFSDAAALHASFSLVCNVDASTVKRLGLGPVSFESVTLPIVTFDHHPDNPGFGALVHADPTACATAEVLFLFARFCQWRISPRTATLFLLGITTDSGCFRFSNTTPRAHRLAADLLELGADNARIIDRAYLSKPMNMAAFEAELFSRSLRTAFDGKFAWFLLSRELMQKYNVDVRNTEQLIEILRGIDGVVVAALIKPASASGIFKISLRSKDPTVSVGAIARRLNGGGHEMAAGGSIFAKSVDNAEDILLNHVQQELFP